MSRRGRGPHRAAHSARPSAFGGAEVGCAVALEVLDLLAAPGFLEHVRAMAALFAAGLSELSARHPALLREVRQLGLMMGLKLADPAYGPLLTLAGFQHGLLAIYANNDPSVVQLLPPLIIRPAEVEQVLAALDPMLAWVEAAVAAGASRNL